MGLKYGTVYGRAGFASPKKAPRAIVSNPQSKQPQSVGGQVLAIPQPNSSFIPLPLRPSRRSKRSGNLFGTVNYVPTNILYYDFAYNGYIAGVYAGQSLSNGAASSYAAIVAQAVAFAQAIDELIAYDSSADVARASLIGQLSQSFALNRYTTGLTSASFLEVAEGIVALFEESVANGLVPVPGGGSITPVAPSVITTATYQYPTGVNTSVFADTTANAIVVTSDATPKAGQLMGLGDAGITELATNSLTLNVAGQQIEYPPGTIGTANLVFNGTNNTNGFTCLWQWFTTKGGFWKCLG